MENARVEAIALAYPAKIPTRVSVVHLHLSGFAVSDTPFFDFFNPAELCTIELCHGCIDLGFALPAPMKEYASIKVPRPHRRESDGAYNSGLAAQRTHPGDIATMNVRLPPHLRAVQFQRKILLEQVKQSPLVATMTDVSDESLSQETAVHTGGNRAQSLSRSARSSTPATLSRKKSLHFSGQTTDSMKSSSTRDIDDYDDDDDDHDRGASIRANRRTTTPGSLT